MFTAILVDDEYWALQGIREIFPWKENGFRVVAQTTKSTEALKLIFSIKPDVVFTDIRMPKISGIELMKRIRDAGMDTEFIVISGFDEFTYAQQALRQGAFDYCLKPIDLTSSADLLSRLAKRLDRKREKRDSEIFEILMNGSDASGKNLIGEGLKHSRKFYQAVVSVDSGWAENGEVEACLQGKDFLPVRIGKSRMLYFINLDEDITDRLKEQSFSGASVGISTISPDPDDFQKLYTEADTAAANGFLTEKGGVFTYQSRNVLQTEKLISRLIPQIAQKDWKALKKLIDEIPTFSRSNGLGIQDLVSLWNQIQLYLCKKYPYDKNHMMPDITGYQMLLHQFSDIGAFTESLYAQIREAGAGPSNSGAAPNAAFQELLRFIEEHYQEPLYLRDLAKKYYLNQSYCCYLFRKYTGKTFTEYLNSCRVGHRKELLSNMTLSIEQISQKIGYNDYFYFNKVFKKYCGITPAKFRKSYQGQLV